MLLLVAELSIFDSFCAAVGIERVSYRRVFQAKKQLYAFEYSVVIQSVGGFQ